jgi:hypothetical protein
MKTWEKWTVELPRVNGLNVNNSYLGETLEMKVRRITELKEPITDGSPVIYTERSEGVKPEYNIRTDRFDIALDAMDKVNRSNLAKRMQVVNKESSKDEPNTATNEIA